MILGGDAEIELQNQQMDADIKGNKYLCKIIFKYHNRLHGCE